MVALSRCVGSLALLLVNTEGVRVSKKRHASVAHHAPDTKFIAGVPILNYGLAYGGDASLSTFEQSRTDLAEDWILTLQPTATDGQIDELCMHSPMGCDLSGHPDEGGVAFLAMHGTEKDLEKVIKSNTGIIQFAEPNQVLYMIPELDADPNSDASWGLNRVGASGRGTNQGAGTHIFILDTGVRTTHQDFGDRASPAVDYASGSPVECNGDLQCAKDNQGHGTHCAGSAAGGSFGVATQAFVHGVKVLGDSGAGSFEAIVGSIDWVASSDSRPAVASMSLGGQCPFGFCGLFGVVKTAVETAVENGVTIVVAGGNSNSNACGFVPAFVPAAITVGSTDSEDARSFFSNYGSCTNIWAPGSDITSASHEDDTGSKTFSGTSMACPHVAGAAAMTLENFPEFKAEQVLEKLLSNAGSNYITDLKRGDTNKLLYVGADAPPPPGSVKKVPETKCPRYCRFLCAKNPMCPAHCCDK